MKKFFTLLIALILLCTATLTGCSCNPEVALTFNNSFYGEGMKDTDVSSVFSETLNYTVSYFGKDSTYPIVKDASFPKAITIDENTYTNGSYRTTLKNEPMGYPDNLPASTVASKLNDGQDVFKLETEFRITVNYKINGVHAPNEDYIKNTVYFCYSLNSFAPIYVHTQSEQTLLYFSGNNAIAQKITSDYKTVYQTKSYTIFSEITTYPDNTPETTKSKKTCSNTAKTAVDNTQLFFILRNFSTKKESASTLPVITPSYGNKKNLSIKHEKNSTKKIGFNYNSATIVDEELPVKILSFAVSSNTASGRKQYCMYQTGKTTTVDRNTSMMVEYAEPLVALGSMTCLGGLKFSLTSVSQNY